MDRVLELVRQFATLSGILAGFSFSAAIQLLSLHSQRKIVGAAVTAFSLATLGFLYMMFAFVVLAITMNAHTGDVAGNNQLLKDFVTQVIGVGSLAVVAFLTGMSLSSWVWSRIVGIIVTATALLTLVGMFDVFRIMNTLW